MLIERVMASEYFTLQLDEGTAMDKDRRMSIADISFLKNKYIEASYKFTDLQ